MFASNADIPKAGVLIIGNEIVTGLVQDTNSATICERLNMIGIGVARIISVGDDEASIKRALSESLQAAEIVIVTGGLAELRTLHDILNTGPFESVENFAYAPHVTVAQEIPPENVSECLESVRARWTQNGPPPAVRIESLTFVQQKSDGTWANLAELWLGRPQPVSR